MPNHVPHFSTGRRIQVRRSGVHGRGVFALQDIAEGEVIVEYAGKVISYEESQRRHPHDPAHPNHTFFFQIDGDRVIDGGDGGNSARWINHSCEPNCFAEEVDDRIFISALRNINAGEELGYDYGLIIEERYTAKLKADYACRCGAAECRGTMLAPKRGWKPKVPASDLPEPVLPKKRKAKVAGAEKADKTAQTDKPAKTEKPKTKAKDKKKSDKKAKADKKNKGQKAAKAGA
ncbi:SET domain-containing protein [Comamonas piscis]